MAPTGNNSNTYNQSIQKTLLLLGGFAIAYNIAIAFHELGHAIAYLIDGGQITEFVLNPFSWSWAEGRNFNNRIFVLWGGVTFGQIFALIPLLLIFIIRSALFVFLSKLLAACAFLVNGIYLSVGAIFNFGDGGTLGHLGVNLSVIIIIGIVYLLISFALWSDLQRHLGMDGHTAFSDRILIVTGGIAPYMIIIFLYNLFHNSRQIIMWGGLAATGLLAAFLIAVLGHLWGRCVMKPSDSGAVSQPYAWKVLVAGLLVVLAEFIVFGTPPNPF